MSLDPPQRRGRPARLDLPRTTVELDRQTKAALVATARARRATLGEVIAEAVRRMLDEAGRTAHCLGRVASGSPRHPLMVAYATPLERYHDPVAGGSSEVPDAR